MPTPDNTLSTLEQIRIRIRRITRNPSSSQISDADIDNYINTFMLYDMPAQLKLDSLEQVLTFFTSANVDIYETNTIDTTAPLYNFKNRYTNVIDPIYVAGSEVQLFQSAEEFYTMYPKPNYKVNIGTGDGLTTAFTGTLDAHPILANHVTVSTVDTASSVVIVTDDGEGGFTGAIDPLSTILYTTGAYYINFTTAPASGEYVWIQAVNYAASKPTSILFVEDKFTLRPIPDMTYRVEVTVNARPTELTAGLPQLAEWAEYISYGAAIKILQDRLDAEGVQMLMPQFKNQEVLITRRKIVQNASRRVPTIYSGGE